MASMAYSEQVGTNLHEGGSRGERASLYSLRNEIRNVFTPVAIQPQSQQFPL
jgi:hypothetical protein